MPTTSADATTILESVLAMDAYNHTAPTGEWTGPIAQFFPALNDNEGALGTGHVLSTSPAEALADTIVALNAAGVTGKFNFLLTDGRVIAATAAGHTLYYRQVGGGVTVASEPTDDDPGWIVVPGGSVVSAVPRRVSVMPLPAAPDLHVPPTPEGRIAIR